MPQHRLLLIASLMAVGLIICAVSLWTHLIPSPAPLPGSANKITGTLREDGAELLYKPSGKLSAQNPAYSPDGHNLLFTVFKDGYNLGAADLMTMTLDNDHKTTILSSIPDRANVNLPGTSWNGPTSRIAFASDRQDHEEIWTIAADGSQPKQVTNHQGSSGYLEPSFSPDGSWIVFEEDISGTETTQVSSLWKVRSDGSNLTKLVDAGSSKTDNRQPNWSPKGDSIVFQQRQQGSDNWQLFTISPDGNNLRQITQGTAESTDATWSPDGKQLVYSSNYGGLPEANVFVIAADGGKPRRVTTAPSNYDGAPSWSPDGKWISFESYNGADKESPASLWRIAAP